MKIRDVWLRELVQYLQEARVPNAVLANSAMDPVSRLMRVGAVVGPVPSARGSGPGGNPCVVSQFVCVMLAN